jgi:hypothetical protein
MFDKLASQSIIQQGCAFGIVHGMFLALQRVHAMMNTIIAVPPPVANRGRDVMAGIPRVSR